MAPPRADRRRAGGGAAGARRGARDDARRRLPRRLRRGPGRARRGRPAHRRRRQRLGRLVEPQGVQAPVSRRLVNVGIAEQNMVGVSAGLANGGKMPFACGASCFLTGRALEQIKADLAYSRHNVKLCGMSSGMAYGELGPTHHSIEDLAWTRAIANLTVIVPADPIETAQAVRAAAALDGPVFLRISRMPVPDVHGADAPFEIGRAATLRDGADVTIIAAGVMVSPRARRRRAARGGRHQRGRAQHVDHPADRPRQHRRAPRARGPIVTVEEHTVVRRAGQRGGRSRRRDASGADADARRAGRVRADRLGGVPARAFRPDAEGIRDAARVAGAGAEPTWPRSTPRDRSGHDQHQGPARRRARRDRVARAASGRDRVSAAGLGRAGRGWRSGARSRRRSTSVWPRRRPARRMPSRSPISASRCSSGSARPASRSGPCIVWQCRRTAPSATTLRERGSQPLLEARTGLTIDPLFSASKMRWLLDAIADGDARAAAGELCAGTIDSWVLWNLTGGAVHACDATNASRTQLFNLRRRRGTPSCSSSSAFRGRCCPRSGRRAACSARQSRVGRLPAGISDRERRSATLTRRSSATPRSAGRVKATYGTGSSLMTPSTPARSRHGLSTTVAWAFPARSAYALEGNITVTGGAVDWLGQFLGARRSAAAVADWPTVADTGGVYLVPAFAGLGAPYWDATRAGSSAG